MFNKLLALYTLFGIPGEDWEYFLRTSTEWELLAYIHLN